MKKVLFLFFLCLMSVSTAIAADVYVTPKGEKYHEQQDCRHLKRSKEINKMSLSEAKGKGYSACSACYPEEAKNKSTVKEAVNTQTKDVNKAIDAKKTSITKNANKTVEATKTSATKDVKKEVEKQKTSVKDTLQSTTKNLQQADPTQKK